MVLTSLSCGTFVSCTGSRVRSVAHISGRAAFFAPEMRTSPARGAPPSMTSLSIRLLWSERAHGQRVDLLAHASAERRVHHLVPLHASLSAERFAHDNSLEVPAVACHPHVAAGDPALDVALDFLWRHHGRPITDAACSLGPAGRAPARKRFRGSRKRRPG